MQRKTLSIHKPQTRVLRRYSSKKLLKCEVTIVVFLKVSSRLRSRNGFVLGSHDKLVSTLENGFAHAALATISCWLASALPGLV